MREFSVESTLKTKLKRVYKKDKDLYEAVIKKMREIVASKDIGHYKNLKKPLQEFKRVHVKKSFVLIFKYVKKTDTVLFFDLDHHDKVYKK